MLALVQRRARSKKNVTELLKAFSNGRRSERSQVTPQPAGAGAAARDRRQLIPSALNLQRVVLSSTGAIPQMHSYQQKPIAFRFRTLSQQNAMQGS
jgi:hypothetical protein